MPSLTVLRWIYVLSLAALGSFAPFLGGRLEALGFDGVQVGLLLAMLPLGRIVSSPLWAAAADRWKLAGTLLRVGCSVSTIGGVAVIYGETGAVAAAGLFCFAAGRAPLGPIVDSLTVRALPDPREYGKVRAWGSAGFLVAALAAGVVPADVGRGLATALLVATTAATWAVPREGEGGPAPILPALRALLRERFLVPLLLTGALQALTLSVYDTFFSARVRALGLPEVVTSWAIVVGVAGEIVLMRLARPLLHRFGAARLLQFAALAAVPRWWLTAHCEGAIALVATQALHAVSFAAFWVAGVETMARHAPRAIAASAQALFSAASYGVGALVGALLAGWLRARFGTAELFDGLAAVSVLAWVAATWLQAREAPVST